MLYPQAQLTDRASPGPETLNRGCPIIKYLRKKKEKITTISNKLQVKIKPKGEIGSSE